MITTVYPDLGAVGGGDLVREIIGALLTILLITSVLMLIVCSVTWAITTSNGNYQSASRARAGAWVACGVALLSGAGAAWINFLIGVGAVL